MDGHWPSIAAWWSIVTWTEIFGTLTGLWCVWLYGRESIWAWPTGITNALLFMFMFYNARLYSDVILQIVFLLLSIHGWIKWLRGGPAKSELHISIGISRMEWVVLPIVAAAVAILVGGWFAKYTDAALPYWDSTILALSLVAQWLLNKKQLENWLVWMTVDFIAVGVYAWRSLFLTSLLYAIFFCLAFRGFVFWRRSVNGSSRIETAVA